MSTKKADAAPAGTAGPPLSTHLAVISYTVTSAAARHVELVRDHPADDHHDGDRHRQGEESLFPHVASRLTARLES